MGVAYNTSIVTDGLVFGIDAANPRCYSGSGITAYSLTNGLACNFSSSIGFTTRGNGGFVFDGTVKYITLPTTIDTNNDFTINFWNRRLATNTLNTLLHGIDLTSYLQIRYGTSNTVQIVKSNLYDVGSFTGYTSTSGIDVYLTVRLTKSSNTYDLYINGSYISSIASTQTYVTSGPILGGGYENFIGNIYSFTYYNRVLSAQEISQNFNATRGRYGI